MPRTSYAIAIGSNRRHGRHGSPDRVVGAAVAAMAKAGLEVEVVSPILRTPALGPAGRSFANGAALVRTTLEPPALLALLKGIERGFGRRRGRRWGARVLDLDVAMWSGGRWSHGLEVPHAAMAERAFVLVPLARIAPGWRHPATGLSVRQMLARLMRLTPARAAHRKPAPARGWGS